MRDVQDIAIPSEPLAGAGSDWVKQEYFFLQATVEDLNKQSLEIKKLSIGLTSALFFTKNVLELDARMASIGIAVMVVAFWWLDWLWKEFQRAHYERLHALESDLKGRLPMAPEISSRWFLAFNGKPRPPKRDGQGSQIRSFFWPHVFLPHAVILLLALASLLPISQPSSHRPAPSGAAIHPAAQP